MRKRVLALLVTSVLASSTARADKPADAVDACITSSEAAQRQRAQGYLRVSRARAVECLDPRCPAEIRRDCDALITTLARLTPTVVFRVRGPDGADVAAQIEVDGQPTELDGRARALDPGPHDVSASAPGFVATRTRIIVEEGVLARVVELRPVPIPIAPAPSPVVHTSRSKLTWLASGSLSTLAWGSSQGSASRPTPTTASSGPAAATFARRARRTPSIVASRRRMSFSPPGSSRSRARSPFTCSDRAPGPSVTPRRRGSGATCGSCAGAAPGRRDSTRTAGARRRSCRGARGGSTRSAPVACPRRR